MIQCICNVCMINGFKICVSMGVAFILYFNRTHAIKLDISYAVLRSRDIEMSAVIHVIKPLNSDSRSRFGASDSFDSYSSFFCRYCDIIHSTKTASSCQEGVHRKRQSPFRGKKMVIVKMKIQNV